MNEPRPVLPRQGQPTTTPHQPQIRPPAAMPRPAGVQPLAERAAPAAPVVQAAPSAAQPAPPPLPAARRAGNDGDGRVELIELEEASPSAPAVAKPAITHTGAPPLGAAGAAGVGAAPVSKIKLSGGGDKHNFNRFTRPPTKTGTGATRTRTFHGRLSDEGLAFMDDKINEWIDAHPDVEVKHVNTVIGPIEGRHGEQAMYVTIWY